MRDSATGKGRASARNVHREVKLSGVVSGARFIGCDDIVARSCQDEARRCRPGDVFVAREVLAKHDENYMPPEAAEAMKRAQGGDQAYGKTIQGAKP